jgi:hypothetical protein
MFGNDKVFAPLQAADMVSYCGRKITEREDGLWDAPMKMILEEFGKISPIGDIAVD